MANYRWFGPNGDYGEFPEGVNPAHLLPEISHGKAIARAAEELCDNAILEGEKVLVYVEDLQALDDAVTLYHLQFPNWDRSGDSGKDM